MRDAHIRLVCLVQLHLEIPKHSAEHVENLGVR